MESFENTKQEKRVEIPEGREGVQVRKEIGAFEDRRVLWECRNLNPSRFDFALPSLSLSVSLWLEYRFYRSEAIQPTTTMLLVWPLGIQLQTRPPFRCYYDTATTIFVQLPNCPRVLDPFASIRIPQVDSFPKPPLISPVFKQLPFIMLHFFFDSKKI